MEVGGREEEGMRDGIQYIDDIGEAILLYMGEFYGGSIYLHDREPRRTRNMIT